jgi:hypothetical protein
VFGVALSSYADASFDTLGFFCAALSNFMFSFRSIKHRQLRLE